jgi:hypothetical protein
MALKSKSVICTRDKQLSCSVSAFKRLPFLLGTFFPRNFFLLRSFSYDLFSPMIFLLGTFFS